MVKILSDIISPNLVDIASRKSSLGGVGNGAYAVISGHNTTTNATVVPANIDHQGYTFFTKPCLNLSYNNVIGVRGLAFLSDQSPLSMANAIRCMLNPPGYDVEMAGRNKDLIGDNYRSKLINDESAFIPMLSNSLVSISGWRDKTVDTFTSKETLSKSQVSFVDSPYNDYSTYDLTAVFANIEGDPITTMFRVWTEYSQRVAGGSMVPFPINIVENRVDYNTRIIRFIMDSSKTYIQRVVACGAAFPIAVPLAANINFTAGTPLSDGANQVSIPFRCMGTMYDDPAILTNFNKVVQLNNKNMLPKNRTEAMVKLSVQERTLFSGKVMFPWVNIETNELEWWVDKSIYDAINKLIGVKQ